MEPMWHNSSIEVLEKKLNTDIADGISITEARSRLEKQKSGDGRDVFSLFVPPKRRYLSVLFSVLLTPGIIILLLIACLSFFFDNSPTSALCLAITVIYSVTVGIILRSSQKKADLQKEFASPMVRVRRGGSVFHIDGRNVVCGDVILLSRGDLLPCDARLIFSNNLKVKEIFNTKDGIRNRCVSKNFDIKYSNSDSVKAQDAENMLYAGSAVIEGDAVALVCRTGADVYLAGHLKSGALSGNEDGNRSTGVLLPIYNRIIFISYILLAIISLISLVTLRSESLADNFIILLSCVALCSIEALKLGQRRIYSSYFAVPDRKSQNHPKHCARAHIRGISTAERLTEVTHLVLLGNAAVSDGKLSIRESYISGQILKELSNEDKASNKLFTFIHTYIKALTESKEQNELLLDGVIDALNDHLHTIEFDFKGASLVLNSLYFKPDGSGMGGYACAETYDNDYRVVLTFDDSVLSLCRFTRYDGCEKCRLFNTASDVIGFKNSVEINGGRCLYIISETHGEPIFEGAISLYEKTADISEQIAELRKMGIKPILIQTDERLIEYRNENYSMILDAFGGRVASASRFMKEGKTLPHEIGEYDVYLGFSLDEVASIVTEIRKNGGKVAAYGIDNRFYDTMSCADVAISSDTVNYASAKHRESSYDNIPVSGRDTNLRCSQQMRLLSRVIVKRSHERGGGISSVLDALKRSRMMYVSFAKSLMLWAIIMTSLAVFAGMSAILGIKLMNSVHILTLAAVGTVFSMTVFSYDYPKNKYIYQNNTCYLKYPLYALKECITELIARAAITVLVSIAIKLSDIFGAFGDSAEYSMVLFISVLVMVTIDFIKIIFKDFRKGHGRTNTIMCFVICYAALLFVCGIMTQGVIYAEIFPNGIGAAEFVILPIYCFLQLTASVTVDIIKNRRK